MLDSFSMGSENCSFSLFLISTTDFPFSDLSIQQHNKPSTKGGGGAATSTTSLLGGRVTPATSVGTSSSAGGRHYTLKEYEQELDKLQRENYNLKLRIYQLEGEYSRRGALTDDMAKKVTTVELF